MSIAIAAVIFVHCEPCFSVERQRSGKDWEEMVVASFKATQFYKEKCRLLGCDAM
jgi:hypothetical protein